MLLLVLLTSANSNIIFLIGPKKISVTFRIAQKNYNLAQWSKEILTSLTLEKKKRSFNSQTCWILKVLTLCDSCNGKEENKEKEKLLQK